MNLRIVRDKVVRVVSNDWNPELHPRDEGGKFTERGGTISSLLDSDTFRGDVAEHLTEKTNIEFDLSNASKEQAEVLANTFSELHDTDTDRLEEFGEWVNSVEVVDNPNQGYIGVYDERENKLKFNANNFETPENYEDDMYVASEDTFMRDAIIHELGHALHFKYIEESDLSKFDVKSGGGGDITLSREERNDVSQLAGQNAFEVVAELFLLRSKGDDWPDDPTARTAGGDEFVLEEDKYQRVYENMAGPMPINLEQ